MIHLDANYLILATVAGSPEAERLRSWLSSGEALATSAVAWMEFVTGPVYPAVVAAMHRVIEGRIEAVGQAEAEHAARLFNLVGRRRTMRYDCLIAACAMSHGAALATANRKDFLAFAPHGLRVA